MKTRRHHNTKGYRQIKNGKTRTQIEIIKRKLKNIIEQTKGVEKMSNNYSSEQLDRLVQEIECMLNDFEGGISEKDETIKSLADLTFGCAINAVNHRNKYVISLIDGMMSTYKKSEMTKAFDRGYEEALTELKQKILGVKK